MTKDEALKLALEALNDLSAWNDGEVGGHMDEPYSAEVARRTITAIKEALAESEQEPLAWEQFYPDIGKPQIAEALAKEKALQALHDENERLGLYKDAYAEQDCVGWFGYDTGLRLWFETNKGDDGAIPLYKRRRTHD